MKNKQAMQFEREAVKTASYDELWCTGDFDLSLGLGLKSHTALLLFKIRRNFESDFIFGLKKVRPRRLGERKFKIPEDGIF